MIKKIFNSKTIIFGFLVLIILLLLFIKLRSSSNPIPDSNSSPTPSFQNSSTLNPTNNSSPISNSSNSEKPVIPSSSTNTDTGTTNSNGDKIYLVTEDEPIGYPDNYQYTAPTLSPQEEQLFDVNINFPLARLLPYQGKYFYASRYLDNNNLEIIVSRRDQTDLAKQEAQDWLVKTGADKYDHFTVNYR